jgi:hypothetical protein
METYYLAGGAAAVGIVLGFLLGRMMSGGRRPEETGGAPSERAGPPLVKEDPAAPLRMLNILQREGRLVDFLLEDIGGIDDAQIGAAVRDIHRSCRKAIEEHLVLERIMAGDEGQEVTVPTGFDPAAIRLTGNVTGQPPFRGTLQHHGWRVKKINLPASTGTDAMVIAPAEVQLN